MPASLPEHEERAIRNYVEGQTRDPGNPEDPAAKVLLVQKVADYRAMGTDFDVYDVHLPAERWWVITQPTNLYSQDRFPNYDEAFSFHLGIGFRLAERSRLQIDPEKELEIGPAWRRYEAAVTAMETAEEAEDYQAIGIKCREVLLALGRTYQEAPWLTLPVEPPRGADFKGWATLYAETLTTGRARRFLVAIAEKTWDMAVSLQHDSNATEWDAELLLDATVGVLNAFLVAVTKMRSVPPTRCPACGSYRLTKAWDVVERGGVEGGLTYDACSACGYTGTETFEVWEHDDN